MSEWSIEHAWKACVQKCTEGSNPSLSARIWKNGTNPPSGGFVPFFQILAGTPLVDHEVIPGESRQSAVCSWQSGRTFTENVMHLKLFPEPNRVDASWACYNRTVGSRTDPRQEAPFPSFFGAKQERNFGVLPMNVSHRFVVNVVQQHQAEQKKK